jgi:hypothetical protein
VARFAIAYCVTDALAVQVVEDADLLPDQWTPVEEVFFGSTGTGATSVKIVGKNTITAPLATILRQSEYAYVSTTQPGMQTPPDNLLAVRMISYSRYRMHAPLYT